MGLKYLGNDDAGGTQVMDQDAVRNLFTSNPDSTYILATEAAVAASPNSIVRRGSTGQVTVPATPSTSNDAVGKGYVDGNFVLGNFTIASSSSAPGSGTPANRITLVI